MINRRAYAKINLSLDVLRRREDGYHDVKMVMQTVGIFDELTFEKSEGQNEQISLNILDVPKDADLGPIEKNLIYRAARLVLEKYKITDDIKITLKKNIPVAAGMAGGSTDAAAVFHGLNELFNLEMSMDEMCQMGVTLGADIPYCIMGGCALSEGIGEILTPIVAPPKAVLLIAKPPIAVSTKFVYENLHANDLKPSQHPDVDSMIEAIKLQDVSTMANRLGNVLETVTASNYPEIENIKAIMRENGALNALMSGSGPTVFGIFGEDTDDNRMKAEQAMKAIKDAGLSNEVFITGFVN